jgi:hypothetical protein
MLNHRARSPACRPLRRSEEHRGRLRRDTWMCFLVCTILCEKSPITLSGQNHGGLRNRLGSCMLLWISGIPTQVNIQVPEYAANKNLSAIASCSLLGRGVRAARAAQPPLCWCLVGLGMEKTSVSVISHRPTPAGNAIDSCLPLRLAIPVSWDYWHCIFSRPKSGKYVCCHPLCLCGGVERGDLMWLQAQITWVQDRLPFIRAL